MMKALTCATLLTLSGCATVSMVSKDAVVESEQSEESSALSESATAFNTRAEARGWVGEPRGLMDFARVLLGGSGNGGAKSGTYADRISASEADPADVFETITADAGAAHAAFSEVEALARTVLDSGEVLRSDLINFETALVTAQKCYRGFSEAAGIVAARDKDGLDVTEAALDEFAGAIDTARDMADRLAGAYAARDSESGGDAAS